MVKMSGSMIVLSGSKRQFVALSTAKADYVALGECANDIRFDSPL